MANIAQTVNVLQSVILTDGEDMLLTPTYHIFRMFKSHSENTLLGSFITSEYLEENKKTPAVYYPTDDLLNQAFVDYVKMRKEMKKPMSERAVQLAMNTIERLSGGDNDTAIRIIEQSIEHSWIGLFELKDNRNSNKGKAGTIDWDAV